MVFLSIDNTFRKQHFIPWMAKIWPLSLLMAALFLSIENDLIASSSKTLAFRENRMRHFRCLLVDFSGYARWQKKYSIDLSTHRDEGLRKQPLSFDEKVSPAKNPSQRLQTLCGLSISSDIAKCAKCFRHEAKKQQ